jgi:hypothetical protein
MADNAPVLRYMSQGEQRVMKRALLRSTRLIDRRMAEMDRPSKIAKGKSGG